MTLGNSRNDPVCLLWLRNQFATVCLKLITGITIEKYKIHNSRVHLTLYHAVQLSNELPNTARVGLHLHGDLNYES